MISDRIESYLNKINENTKHGKLKWRPITEYLNYYDDNDDLTTSILLIKDAMYSKLHENTSFFLKDGDAYLVLIDKEFDSMIDGSRKRTRELWGVFHKNASVYHIPAYLKDGIETLQRSIIEYWEFKKGDYSVEASDLFDFLDKFSH